MPHPCIECEKLRAWLGATNGYAPAAVAGHEPTQAQLELSYRRYDLAKSVVPVLWIASLWIPLRGALPVAKALAGKHTSVTLTLTISIAFTAALASGVLALLRRSAVQREELIRLRRRISTLERELESERSK